ncbi:ATP-dependent helicase/nuclease subunit A [Talaromyces islandicus]|uniref:ATP-dependent helicase/nuclease subunit A n=1 Tax=Talaromyces islandicus TaxID=28573 RepID=A0A0U1M7U1_TALIS|nr:ATP-dependent helicase/nuclease subunit A [Talaromyces islandicus]
MPQTPPETFETFVTSVVLAVLAVHAVSYISHAPSSSSLRHPSSLFSPYTPNVLASFSTQITLALYPPLFFFFFLSRESLESPPRLPLTTMPRDTSSVIVASTWTFNPDAAQEFCTYLKTSYPQISEVTYTKKPSKFTIEGHKVGNDGVKFGMLMKEFVEKDRAKRLNAPRIFPVDATQIIDYSDNRVQTENTASSDFHILDLPVAEPSALVTETWNSQHGQLGPTQGYLFKEIGEATKTEITLNVDTRKIQVSGESTAHVQQAFERLSNLDTAMMLTRRDSKNYSHHLFLPSNADGDLKAVLYEEHPAANLMQSLATAKEWGQIWRMMSVISSDLSSSTVPRVSAASRYWAEYQFNGFRKSPQSTESQPGIAISSGSSETNKHSELSNGSDGVSVVKAEEGNLHPPVEKAARVAEWVHRHHEVKNTDDLLIDFEAIEKPDRRPARHPEEEQERIPGLLKRRVRLSSKPVKHITTQEEKTLMDSMDHWTVLKPQVHRTMAQKSGPSTETGPDSRKQLTLEDCWRRNRAASKAKITNTTEQPQKETTAEVKVSTVEEKVVALSLDETPKPAIIQAKQFLASVQDSHHKKALRHKDAQQIKEVFHGLAPFLNSARCYPGVLKLEICFGLIILNPFPTGQVDEENVLSVEDWNTAFRPRNNLRYPFWIWKKLTSSGTDMDSLVDLKSSIDNTRRMFEQVPVNSEITYEFHCQCRDGALFFIVLDKDGNASVFRPGNTIGTSAIHSPQGVWDMNVLLKGFLKYRRGRDPKLDKAIDAFVDSIHLQPGKTLYVHCNEPADGIFSVDKILLKRSTRHRHLPLNEGAPSDLMLQVTEVQQFLVGRKANRLTMIRGRIELQKRADWAARKFVWFEASIVSGAIEKLLDVNSHLNMGEKTDKWDAADLLGDEVDLAGASNSYDTNPVAKSVGNSSFGNMLRLGRTMLSQMKIGKSA